MPAAVRAPAPPRLSSLVDRPLSPDDLTDDMVLTRARVRDAYAEQASADFAEVAGVEFASGTMAGSQWYRGRWVDIALTGVDLANAVFIESAWERVAGTGVRATGLQLTQARVTDVTLSDCPLRLLNLRRATLRRVRLSGCDLTDSQWGEADLTDVELVGCRLAGAEMSTIGRLARVRLIDCDLDGISGLGALRGAVVRGADPLVVATALAREAGLSLE